MPTPLLSCRWILLAGLLLAAAVASSSAAETGRKWNVLLVMADDWRPEIGCYGSPGMLTPNVDKLAAGGVRFDRAYCQFPVCNPSRVSMLTGRYPNVTGVVFNGTRLRDLHPDWVTLPEHFKNHGYVTANAGKIFHGKIPDPQSWIEAIDDVLPPEFRAGQRAPAEADEEDGPAAPGARFVVLDGDGESDRDYHIAQAGIRLLEKYKDRPFFIGIGFHRPHAIPTAPRKFYDLYDPAKMRLAPDFAPRPTLPEGIPSVALPATNDTYMPGDTSPEVARQVIRAYRASASWTDWNIGRVLNALARLGLAEKTIVVFTSDHGYHNGEKGRWGKTTVFEIAQRVPLIVRLPGATANGRTCARTVQSLDLYPTLVELCGLPQPEGLQGHSYTRLLQERHAAWLYAAFSMAKTGGGPIGYCVRTEHWRYAEWQGGAGGAVLFDVRQDTHEMTNLANQPQQAQTVAEMKTLLKNAFASMPERISAPARSARVQPFPKQ